MIAPETPATGSVVNCSDAATPVILNVALCADVSPELVAINVMPVPYALPATPENVTVPFEIDDV